MRHFKVMAFLLGLGFLLSGSHPGAVLADVEQVTTVRWTDPSTGLECTRVVRIQENGTMVPIGSEVKTVLGAPVVSAPVILNRGFPLNPVDGQEFWMDGVKYEWDSSDDRWEQD